MLGQIWHRENTVIVRNLQQDDENLQSGHGQAYGTDMCRRWHATTDLCQTMNDHFTMTSLPGRPSSAAFLSLVVVLLAGLIAPCTATSADNSGVAGTLYWRNGDNSPGQLIDSTSSYLRWQSSIFGSPFTLDLKHLTTIQFAHAEMAEETAEPLRFIMQGGDVVYGKLVDATDEHFVIASKRHGQIEVRRAEIQSFWRIDNPALVDLGPAGTVGWRTPSRSRGISEWKMNADGQLTTSVHGAELFRDLKLPAISAIDIALRWNHKPGFLITFATESAIRFSKESVKLETWEYDLVLQTLASNGDFETLQTLTKEANEILLRLLWNQQTGEMSVYTHNGELLGRMAAGRDPNEGLAGLYIQNKGSDLTLLHLRVSKWNGVAPSKVVDGQSRMHLIKGDVVYGKVSAFDKSTGSFTVEESSRAKRQVALADIASVYLGNDGILSSVSIASS